NFAKGYIASCEERYGPVAVERTLDAAHALMSHGIFRYPGKKKLDLAEEEKRELDRREHQERMFNDLWRTVPAGPGKTATELTDGNYLEFLQSHTNVVFQPGFDDPRFSGFNPYALGFAMMQDLERIVSNPEDEDREWFPDIAGTGDIMGVLRDVWANYRDESFI